MRIAFAVFVSLCAVACGDPVEEPQTIEVTSNQQAVAVDTGDKPPAPPSGDADRPCDRSGGPPPTGSGGPPPGAPPDCRKAPERCPSGSTCASDGLCRDADGHPVRPPPPRPPQE